MADAESFLNDIENRNQDSIRRNVEAYTASIAKESFVVTDVLKLELRAVIESIEVAALWLPDGDSLEMKLALASWCGDGARYFEDIVERLDALGCPLASFDPRFGGYSKLFAFFRSLQTIEERASAGFSTLGTMNATRLESLGFFCESKDDLPSATLLRERLIPGQRRLVAEGRQMLLGVVTNEESQARARRAAYRTIELLSEVQDAATMRKYLARSLRK